MMVILPADPMAAGIPDVLVEQEDATNPKKTKRTSDGRLEIFMFKGRLLAANLAQNEFLSRSNIIARQTIR